MSLGAGEARQIGGHSLVNHLSSRSPRSCGLQLRLVFQYEEHRDTWSSESWVERQRASSVSKMAVSGSRRVEGARENADG